MEWGCTVVKSKFQDFCSEYIYTSRSLSHDKLKYVQEGGGRWIRNRNPNTVSWGNEGQMGGGILKKKPTPAGFEPALPKKTDVKQEF